MNRNPLNLPRKEPDEKCNARTKKGYCKHKAGFRTHHPGEGRCYLHGGSSLSVKRNSDPYVTSVYTSKLPTSLQIELHEITKEPVFASLFQEFAILKLVVQGLLTNLPADISSIYGQPVCSECKKNLELELEEDEKNYIFIKYDYKAQEKRLDKLVSTIESISRIFERISKHEERQKRFIPIHEIENIMVQWGKVLMKWFGDHPNIEKVQQEIMEIPFTRDFTDSDDGRLEKMREIQRQMQRQHSEKRKRYKKKKMSDIFEEIEDI